MVTIQGSTQLSDRLIQLCWRSVQRPWRAQLRDILNLFAELAHSTQALLLLLDEEGNVSTCIENNDASTSRRCKSWQTLSPQDLLEFSMPAMARRNLPETDQQGWVVAVPRDRPQPIALLVFEDIESLPNDPPWAESLAITTPLIQNARLEYQKEIAEEQVALINADRLRRGRLISGAVQFMGSLGNLHATLQALLKTTQEVIDIDHVGLIYRIGGDTEEGYHRLGNEFCTDFLIRFYSREEGSAPDIHDTRLQMVDAWDGPYELSEIARRGGFHTALTLPLHVPGHTVGAMLIARDEARSFHEEEILRATMLSSQAALALHNNNLFQQSQRRQFYLEGLNSVISAINRITDLDTILYTGLNSALEIAEMDHGGIYIWDLHNEQLQLRVHQGFSVEEIAPIESHIPGEGITGRAFQQQQTVVEREVKEDTDDLPEMLIDVINLQISVPLVAEGQSIGVLSMSRQRGGELSQDVIALLRAIADQLALAVQRGQMARTLREQIDALHHLYEMSAALLGQIGTREVIFVLLRTLQDVVPEALLTVFYTSQEENWERAKAYLRNGKRIDGTTWQQESPSAAEHEILERCRSRRSRIHVDDPDSSLLQGLSESLGTDVRQALYYPLFMPTNEFFGILGVILKEASPLSPQKSALVQAIIQQGTAAIARMSLYETTREEESRLRAILESSQDGIFLVGGDQKIHYVNEQALHLLRISGTTGGWEGRTFPHAILAIREESRDLAHLLLERVAHTGSPPPFTTSIEPSPNFETRQGRTLTLRHWPVYSQQNQLLGGLFLFRDVTEQIAVERMRDDLLHMLVHDLRNPIAVIINALQIAQDPHMHDIVQEASTLALGNAEQILTLINAILDIGRLESDRFEIDPRPTRLQPLLQPLHQHIALSAKEVTLETQLSEDLPYVLIDPIIVERVFRNLIDNALKFVPEKEGIIRISAQSNSDFVTVEVYNNGPGIPPEMKLKLFEKFAKGEYRGQGYGLGLAFCRLAIEAHSGKIWTENRSGGVSFYLTLPAIKDMTPPM